ncbi:MAG TPA: hypothetical protein VGO87_08440, partial [Acidimicrobiia bacterium]
MSPSRYHPHVSHLVRVAPRPAGAGLDFARWCLSSPDAVGDEDCWWEVSDPPAGTMRLGGPFHRAVPRPRGYQPLRMATGIVCPTGRLARPVAVTLELLPWSSRWSELALTGGPLAWWERGPRAEQAYLRAANATVAHLARTIETPPARWL